MAEGNFINQPPTAFAAATGAHHVRRRAGLVEEDQPFRVERSLSVLPLGAGLGDVRAILLGGVQSLFLKLMLLRSKNRQIELTQVSI